MPQLDFGNPLTIAQIVWLGIIFAVLYWLSSRWALPRVGAVLEKRAAAIGADLEAAHDARSKADAAAAEIDEAIRSAQQAAQARISEAVAKGKDQSAKVAAEDAQRIEARLAEAERQIEAARRGAFIALRGVAVDTAGLVLTRLTGNTPDRAVVDSEVGSVLAQRAEGTT